jgi:hypothetical protein
MTMLDELATELAGLQPLTTYQAAIDAVNPIRRKCLATYLRGPSPRIASMRI